jgi:hypothetical protein
MEHEGSLPCSQEPATGPCPESDKFVTTKFLSHDSSAGIALGYGLDDRVLGFDSRRGLGIFLFSTASRPALGSTQPPIQWVPGALSLGVKRLGREADRSPPSSADVKECV